jgi:predicted PurR-regulated permease PerM
MSDLPPPHETEATATPVAVVAGSALSPIVRVSIVGTFIILFIGALFYARSFFLPLALALLVTLTFAPLVRALLRRGIPAGVSAVLLVLVIGGGIGGASTLLSDPIAQMISEAPTVIKQVRERFAFLRQPFSTLNEASREIEALTQNAGDAASTPERVVVAQPGMLTWAAGTLADIGTTLGAMLILSLFLLASGETLRHKLVRVMPLLSEKKRSLRVLRDIENEVSRYLLTITAINAGFGACVGTAMWILGMPNPLLWGIGAGLLNYVPYVGGLTGMVLCIAVSVITYPSFTQAALPPIAYLAIQMIESNFVTPMILGRRLELNTVAILIFLALTTWMWGIVGTIIGVPLLVVVKVFADTFPSLAPLGEFLSSEAGGEEPESEIVDTPPAA